jgi:hypothetical protein
MHVALSSAKSRYYWRVRAYSFLQRKHVVDAPATLKPIVSLPPPAGGECPVPPVPAARNSVCTECFLSISSDEDGRVHAERHEKENRARQARLKSRVCETESRGWFASLDDWMRREDPSACPQERGSDAESAASSVDAADALVEAACVPEGGSARCVVCGEPFDREFSEILDTHVWREACLVPDRATAQWGLAHGGTRLRPPESDVLTGRVDDDAMRLYHRRVAVERWLFARVNEGEHAVRLAAYSGKMAHPSCI